MSNFLKNIFRFLLLMGVQILILNKVPPIHQFVVPYLYFLFILWLPFSIGRFSLLIISFLTGLTIDYFTHSPGLHAAPCLLIGYLRPFLLNLLIPQETTEQSYIEPSPKSMGFNPYAVYILIFTILHHSYLVLIEWLQFGSFVYFAAKVGATTGISLLLILVSETIALRKSHFRTNKA